MIQLADVLLSVLVMACHLLAGGLVPYQPNDSSVPLASRPQDQSAASSFTASLTKYYVGFAHSGPQWTAEVDDVAKQNRAYRGK